MTLLNDLLESGTEVTLCDIDWISVTAPYVEPARYAVPKELRMYEEWDMTRGRLGYDLGAKHVTGLVQLASTTRHDMGVHLVYTGKVLKRIEDYKKMDSYDVLEYHIGEGHKIVRLDLSVDFLNCEVTVSDFQNAFQNHQAVTRAKSGTVVQSLTHAGHTFYIGSRKARKKLLRIYDKAAEQNLDVNWCRAELQLMGRVAERACNRVVKAESKANIIIGILQGFCDFPTVSAWRKLTDGVHPIRVGSIRHEKGGTRKWLETQVLSALVAECVLDVEYWVQYKMMLDKEVKRRLEAS